ncbi:hypothetical protein L226DRAFT_520772 [Lentinus tigrinus ALCF2SS1-7]|uniref:uncharacterized protein n=1 Tax=Lentinus tigrinus ALCF2SS1-7 TaxID=1328758 RepID=UPI001165CE62|nr:hypothetical protein L226DRAFT_520772 [Lentinus tigrinus ALCF2SS1-7]
MPRSPRSRPSEVAGKPEKIPRPPNAWIIYRTDRLNEWKDTRGPNDPPVKQADISRMIGTRWRFEADHVKLEYEKRAAIAKAEHKRKYPNYKYNPMSKEAKEKMRAAEREARKKAREEAKAAKAAGRKVSNGSRVPSNPCTPSSSNVKLEAYDQAVKPLPVPEPINRGCGPSPPIDYDPESSSTASSTPLLSSSSSASIRSSPLPPSSQPPSAALYPSHAPWLQALSSPASSPLAQPPPPPAYPSGYVHSPAPSRQSSYNFSRAFPPSSDASSTPSDSPPSYSEGEGWQPQPLDSSYQTFTPLPEVQNDWNAYAEYQPLLQPDVTFPQPVIDPLLSMPDQNVINFTSTSTEAVFHLSSVQMHSAQSPPGELDPESLQQLLRHLEQQPINAADQLGPVLDMPELHESMEDRADGASLPAPTDMQPCSFEDFAAYINAHPGDAMNLADPGFYQNMSLQLEALQAALFSEGLHDVQAFTPEVPAFHTFPFGMQQQAQQPQIAMPVPVLPMSMPFSSVPTPVETNVVAPTPTSVHTPVSAHPESVSYAGEAMVAQAPRRYVPPGGAGMPARRRVGGRFSPRPSNISNDSN